jgi:hypothetical protein
MPPDPGVSFPASQAEIALALEVASDDAIHTFRCIMLQFWKQVGVRVHREGYLRVAQDFHNHSWRDALGKQQRGAGVTQIVKPALRQTNSVEQAVELVCNHRAIKRSSIRPREDEIGAAGPVIPALQLLSRGRP